MAEQNEGRQNGQDGKPRRIPGRQRSALDDDLIVAGLEKLERREGVFDCIRRDLEIRGAVWGPVKPDRSNQDQKKERSPSCQLGGYEGFMVGHVVQFLPEAGDIRLDRVHVPRREQEQFWHLQYCRGRVQPWRGGSRSWHF